MCDHLEAALSSVVRTRKAYVQVLHKKRMKGLDGRPMRLPPGDVVDARRFGKDIVVCVVSNPKYVEAAKFVRACASRLVSSPLPHGRILGGEMVDEKEADEVSPIWFAQARV